MKKMIVLLTAVAAVTGSVLGFLIFNDTEFSAEEFSHWMNDPDNGMVKEVYVNGLHIGVKYLPVDYLVRSELNKIRHTDSKLSLTPVMIDSLRKLYTRSMTFVLSIGPDERNGKGGDVMFRDITSYQEYVNRAMNLNFEMEKYVSMRVGSNVYPPVLTNLENTYGLNNGRNIILVFSRPPRQAGGEEEGYEIVWDDMMYTTGLHRFFFSAGDIESIPSLSFEKIL